MVKKAVKDFRKTGKWIDENGKELSDDEFKEKLGQMFLDKHTKNFMFEDTKKSFSLIEIIIYPLIVAGIKNAQKEKIKDPEKMGWYILGYLSARLNLDAISDLISTMTDIHTVETEEKKSTKKSK